jgi:hypothetical protein
MNTIQVLLLLLPPLLLLLLLLLIIIISGSPSLRDGLRFQVRSCEVYGRQIDAGAGFLRVFKFPLPIVIPLTAPCSLIIRFCILLILTASLRH